MNRSPRIVEPGELITRLNALYTKEGVGVWLTSPHKLLGNEIPVDVWNAGRQEEVLALVSQMEDGAFV